jgi:hypothetical protein
MRREGYFPKPMSDAYRLLQTGWAKRGRELAGRNQNLFVSWAKTNLQANQHPTSWRMTDWDYDDWLKTLPTQVFDDFGYDHHEDWKSQEHDLDANDSYHLHDPLEITKAFDNKWLVHFTNYVGAVAREGFTRGTDDPKSLGLTTWLSQYEKMNGGYNFAYPLDFLLRRWDGGTSNYGRHAILFQANGITTSHLTDDEQQVIFWGATAHNIVPITNTVTTERNKFTQTWKVGQLPKNGKPVYQSESLPEVLQWVTTNYRQYQRYLNPYKHPAHELRELANELRSFG